MAGDYWITGSHDNEALMNCIECSDDSVVVTDLAEANELAAWHDAVCPARVERVVTISADGHIPPLPKWTEWTVTDSTVGVERQRAEGRDGGV